MIYSVEFTNYALEAMKKLDKHTALLILACIRKNLEGCDNPRRYGKGLSANQSGQWRYRIGNYRLIAEIQEDKVIILVLDVGHRSDEYG